MSTPLRLAPPPFWRTIYFERARLRPDRQAISNDDILQVLAAPYRSEVQPDNRIRSWGYIVSAGRWLRVVTLEDGETVHNSFFDRSFSP